METSGLCFGGLVCLLVIAFAESASGGTLALAWDHNTDARTAGYLVSYGTQSGKYTRTLKAGYVTSVNVTGLTDGTLYFFVVQSYDKDDVAGPRSSEVSGRVPTSTGPTIACPSPVVTSLDGKPMAVTLTPTVTGGVIPVSTTCLPQSGSMFPVGTTSFTCTAVDAAQPQQTGTCRSQVVVKASMPAPPTPPNEPPPNQPPSGGTPSRLTINCPRIPPVRSDTPNVAGPEVRYPLAKSSGGTAPVEVRCSPTSGSRFPFGNTTVACTATDRQGQTASCTTTLTVIFVADN
jgi:hypothetical protein